MFLRIVAGAALALAFAPAAMAESLGACAWARLPAADRAAVITAHQANPRTGGDALRAIDRKVRASAAGCSSRGDIPVRWVQEAVSAEALQASAAGKMRALMNLDRATLDRAWAEAPEDTRTCLRIAATKSFHIPSPPPCHDRKSAIWVLQRIGIPIPAAQPDAAMWALLYYAAKGHTDYADALIARWEAQPPGAGT